MLQEYTWKVRTLAAFACTVYEISPGCAVVATETSAIASIVGDARPSLLNSGLNHVTVQTQVTPGGKGGDDGGGARCGEKGGGCGDGKSSGSNPG